MLLIPTQALTTRSVRSSRVGRWLLSSLPNRRVASRKLAFVTRNRRPRQFQGATAPRLFSTKDSIHQEPQQPQEKVLISYLTDVEGDAAYLDRYVNQSRVVHFVPETPRWRHHQKDTDDQSFEGDFQSCTYFPYDHCIDFLPPPQDGSYSRSMLIFGGDMWDKGGQDLYVIRQLLDLKRRYPDRVHFIMGNRDINKMRIPQEMGVYDDEATEPTLPEHEGVYWLRNFQSRNGGDPEDPSLKPSQTSAPERMKFLLGRTMGSPKAFELRRLELQQERERELEATIATGKKDKVEISDGQVVKSYRQSCHPITGEIGNYLANANLALRIGELFVLHGALPLTSEDLQKAIEAEETGEGATSDFWKDLSFAMPWTSEPSITHSKYTARESINAWIDSLNEFAKQSIDCWKSSYAPSKHSDTTTTKADSSGHQSGSIWALKGGYSASTSSTMSAYNLVQYGMGWTPDGKRNPTVVYSSWSVDGMPVRFFPNNKDPKDRMFAKLVREFFRQSGIKLILAGHQPQGDMPLPIRIDDQQCDNNNVDDGSGSTIDNLGWVLCCDTSYSGDTKWVNPQSQNLGRGQGAGFRGDVAVSETLVEIDTTGRVVDVRCHGVLSDGSAYESQKMMTSRDVIKDEEGNKAVVGHIAEGDWVPSQSETPNQTQWWVKAHLDESRSLLTTAKGYDVSNYYAKRPDP